MPSSVLILVAAGAIVAISVVTGVAIAIKKRSFSVLSLVRSGLVAGLYVTICLVLQPLSFGAVQIRAAEALVLLPVFGPEYIIGVTLGCFIANAIASVPIDALVGTFATMIAGLATYLLRRCRVKRLAVVPALPPVIFNAVIVGLEISFLFGNSAATLPAVLLNMVTVGLGEILSCMVLGVALVRFIEKNRLLRTMFTDEKGE